MSKSEVYMDDTSEFPIAGVPYEQTLGTPRGVSERTGKYRGCKPFMGGGLSVQLSRRKKSSV